MSVVVTETGTVVVTQTTSAITIISPFSVSGTGGVTDHGALTGLADDDHPHYFNQSRGDARYDTKAEVDAKIPLSFPMAEVKLFVGRYYKNNNGVYLSTSQLANRATGAFYAPSKDITVEDFGFNVTLASAAGGLARVIVIELNDATDSRKFVKVHEGNDLLVDTTGYKEDLAASPVNLYKGKLYCFLVLPELVTSFSSMNTGNALGVGQSLGGIQSGSLGESWTAVHPTGFATAFPADDSSFVLTNISNGWRAPSVWFKLTAFL